MPALSQIRQIDYTVIFARDMPAMRNFHETVMDFPPTARAAIRWCLSYDTLPRYLPASVTSSYGVENG
jgi:hypothetical protein